MIKLRMEDNVEKLYTAAEVAVMTDRTSVAVRKLAERYGFGTKLGPIWVFTDADVERVRAINPLGGHPTRDGSPVKHSTNHTNIKRRGPKRTA